MRKAIVNGDIFLGNSFYNDKVLVLENDRILDIVSTKELDTIIS